MYVCMDGWMHVCMYVFMRVLGGVGRVMDAAVLLRGQRTYDVYCLWHPFVGDAQYNISYTYISTHLYITYTYLQSSIDDLPSPSLPGSAL